MPKKAQEDKLILSVNYKGTDYEINAFDLRKSERFSLERHMDKPMQALLSEGWLTGSEAVLDFLAYLGVARKLPALTYAAYAEDDAKISVRVESSEEPEPERPTKSRKTSGSQS